MPALGLGLYSTTTTLYFYPKGQTRAQGVSHVLTGMDRRSGAGTGVLVRRLRIQTQGVASATEAENVTYVDNLSEEEVSSEAWKMTTPNQGCIICVRGTSGN